MEILTLTMLALGVVVSVTASSVVNRVVNQRRAASLRDWRLAAEDLGLSFKGRESERTISGTLDGVPVLANFPWKLRGKTPQTKTAFEAGGDGRIPSQLTVLRARSESDWRSTMYGKGAQIGDADFDAAVEISSIDAEVCAALSVQARKRLASLVGQGGQVHSGTLLIAASAGVTAEVRPWLVQMLRFLSQLGNDLMVEPDSIHQRLADNALDDPSNGVQLQNLRFLFDPRTRTPPALALRTARALLSHSHGPIRLAAATQLGWEGAPVLIELLSDPSHGVALRRSARQALEEHGAPELDAVLAPRLGLRPPELIVPALYIVALRRSNAHAAAVRACTSDPNESVRTQAAIALGHLSESSEAEHSLISLLRDSVVAVQRASVDSLGTIGGIAAIQPLIDVSEGDGPAALNQAARTAIARIQSRLHGAHAGGLSLADDNELAGAVSITESSATDGGEISLAPGEADAPEAPDGVLHWRK